jgi:aryl-alcohol dehydrogenase-like predicted oxidoreductase
MITADRRSFLAAAAASAASPLLSAQTPSADWRNKQSTMSYRRLGRTRMMISEVVSGGDPITPDNYKHLSVALELGLNYLDMAPAYNKTATETAYGQFLGGSSEKRMKVFLTTKVSGLQGVRNRLYKEIFDGLPAAQQEAIVKRSKEMIAERGVMKPGYFFEYYPGQRNQFAQAYISNAMMKDYGHRVEGSKQFTDYIQTSLEGSLKRVGTDHFDILMCPHGACCAEELESPEILATFQTLKKQGKVKYLGLSTHNDPAGVLRKATELGHYDAVMLAYNILNGGYLEDAMRNAAAKGIGMIAMKAAHAVATHHKPLQPIPQWRVDKVQRIVPGDMKAPMKAYVWALQNPHLTAVISNLWDETYVRENLSIAGKKVELQWG